MQSSEAEGIVAYYHILNFDLVSVEKVLVEKVL